MHPVIEQILSFFSSLFHNAFLTGTHRLAGKISSGTGAYEQAELNKLYAEALKLWKQNPVSEEDGKELRQWFLADTLTDIKTALHNNGFPVSDAIENIIIKCLMEFAEREKTLFEAPPKPPDINTTTLKTQTRAKRRLQRYIKHNKDLNHYTGRWRNDVGNLILHILSQLKLPPQQTEDAAPFLQLEAQMLEFASDPAEVVDLCLADATCESATNDNFFNSITWQIFHNLISVTGDNPEHRTITTIDQYMRKNPGLRTADRILDGTPFQTLLLSSIPIPIPEKVRFEHMHILAGSGHGKTQALQHMIVSDLQRPPDEVPAMVILDSQGDMLAKLQRLALFDPKINNSLAKRLLIVDPSDVEFAPSLNLFDIQSDRLQNYSQKDREQVLAGIIEIYDYIFGGLLGAELTQKQSVVFRFLAQLMLAIPGATIHTLRDLLIDASPYMVHIATLPDVARSFFETQFFEHGYKATREQILRRLYGVLQNGSFERMFASPQNRLDLFPVLNDGGIVLVNTAKDFLKTEASSIFGRYIIALTFKAAMERAILPEHERRPTFLWIDEASEYFDDNIDSLLIQARKFKLGVVMAHQYLGQLPRGLPASIMTNTSIKLAGGTSDKDARDLSKEMRTTPEFISSMTKSPTETTFAAYVRNVTPQAMKLTIPFGTVEGLPQMSGDSFELLRDASRKKLSPTPVTSGNEDARESNSSDSTFQSSNDSDFWGKSD